MNQPVRDDSQPEVERNRDVKETDESRDAGAATKAKRGRPRKKAGEMKFEDFRRAGITMSGYDEARQKNQKHSVAVREVAEVVRQRCPEMRISDGGVRRILAEHRPRDGRNIPLFDRSTMTEAERERLRRMLEQVPPPPREQGPNVDLSPEMRRPMPRVKYMIRFGERPTYPRHNAKETTT
jgi:hypothetical protein